MRPPPRVRTILKSDDYDADRCISVGYHFQEHPMLTLWCVSVGVDDDIVIISYDLAAKLHDKLEDANFQVMRYPTLWWLC
jgi:hypothetical protein